MGAIFKIEVDFSIVYVGGTGFVNGQHNEDYGY
jgi:hypothetical protein